MPLQCNHRKVPYPAPAAELDTKTLDVGAFGKGVHASANAWGNLLQINSTHGDHGVITATAFQEFRENLGNSEKVREYRKNLLEKIEPMDGFGVILTGLNLSVNALTREHFKMDEHAMAAARSTYTCPLTGDDEITVMSTIAVTDAGEVRQIRHITTTSETPMQFGWKVAGIAGAGPEDCHVSRASYGQLTEGGMIKMPELGRKIAGTSADFYVQSTSEEGSTLFATLRGQVMVESALEEFPALGQEVIMEVSKSTPVTITSCFRLTEGNMEAAMSKLPLAEKEISRFKSPTQQSQIDLADYIVWRNADYTLNNCCITVKMKWNDIPIDTICVITDHVALPLGWPRDNYWQLRPLMQLRAAKAEVPASWHNWYSPKVYQPKIDKALFGHINWVFRAAQLHSTKKGDDLEIYVKRDEVREPATKKETKNKGGFWARSYIINGKTKDTSGIFQLDQQCYPFLELCDFWKTYADLHPIDGVPPTDAIRTKAKTLVQEILGEKTFRTVLQVLVEHIDEKMGLIKTDETPGDDEVKYGNLYSCNLLTWYTFVRLAELLGQKEFTEQAEALSGLNLLGRAQNIRANMLEKMVKAVQLGESEKEVFSYDCGFDGPELSTELKHVIYADGNDIPTLMTKKWNFVEGVEPKYLDIWHNTMQWMFDGKANGILKPPTQPQKLDKQGNKIEKKIENKARKTFWMGDRLYGLGSVHSEGPWPLGIYQEYRYYTTCVEANEKAQNSFMLVPDAKEKAQKAWEKIEAVYQWDGTFSEAVDAHTGNVTSKAYFSWPGSMIAGAIIDEYLGEF